MFWKSNLIVERERFFKIWELAREVTNSTSGIYFKMRHEGQLLEMRKRAQEATEGWGEYCKILKFSFDSMMSCLYVS